MKKSYLVINTPENCRECPCQSFSYCLATDNEKTIYDIKSKPVWCPLKPMPEKRHEIDDFMQMTFNVVRNICIDEFLGNLKIPLQVGNVISCDSFEELGQKHHSLEERGIITDYLYEKDGEKGFWLEVKEINSTISHKFF